MRIRYAAALATAVLAAVAARAPAQPASGWKPDGNVEFVVGAGAGGENDRIARAIQHALAREHLVESMTVLNRPGAAQTIAINYLASKKGDANAIGLASGSFINAIARSGSSLHKNVTPLMKLFDAYQCYFTRVDSPIKSMADVRDRLKADPSSVTFAFPVGLGSPLHVSVVNVAKAAGAARESLTQLAMSTSPPREGIVPGQKWSSEQPAASAPLAGIEMRSESTYLRDERCRPAESSTALPPRARVVEQACAVILTRFRMSQPRTPRDPTPEEYRKSGLRTAGRWSGSGESLAYISLRTGWVVSVTQSGEQDMDVTVSTRDGGSGVRYAGQVRSQSQITLLPDSSPVH